MFAVDADGAEVQGEAGRAVDVCLVIGVPDKGDVRRVEGDDVEEEEDLSLIHI